MDVSYSRSEPNLERLVAALAPFTPHRRGAPPGLPLAVKRAAGRPRDLEVVAELEALQEELRNASS